MANEKRLIDAFRLTIRLSKRNRSRPLQYDDVLAIIADEKTVDAVEVVHGRWEHKKHKLFGNTYDYVCSVCGCDYALAEYNYCPNCGAKMDGDGNG